MFDFISASGNDLICFTHFVMDSIEINYQVMSL